MIQTTLELLIVAAASIGSLYDYAKSIYTVSKHWNTPTKTFNAFHILILSTIVILM